MKVSQTVSAIVLVIIIAASSGFTGYSIGKAQSRERSLERFHKLKEYGKEHPEQFKKMMQSRRGEIRRRLEKLKKKDPAKYKEMIQGQIERMESTLSELKNDMADTNR